MPRIGKCCSSSSRWSNLPDDILELILKRLGLVDSIRASAVCRSWRCLSDKNKKQQLPLLFSSLGGSTVIRNFYEFCDTSVTCKQTMSSGAIGKRRFGGCSHGWWILYSFLDGGVSLLDPNERRRREIQLPSIPKLSWTGREGTLHNHFSTAILSCPPVTEDCIVIATIHLAYQGWTLALCRPGDKEWTFFRTEARFKPIFLNMIFFKGKCYAISETNAISESNRTGCYTIRPKYKILVCDIGGNNRPPQINDLYDLKEELPKVVIDGRRIKLYLVECRGELLLVIRPRHLPRGNMHVPPVEMFRVDFGTNKLVKVESLGGNSALFLSSRGSSLFSARLFGGKGNCIYYIEDDDDQLLGIFDLSNGKHTFFPINLESGSPCFSHMWVTTDPW